MSALRLQPFPVRRGGRQRIPRPAAARAGGPAPWSALSPDQRRPRLDSVVDALASAPSGLQASSRPSAADGRLGAPMREAGVLAVLYSDSEDARATQSGSRFGKHGTAGAELAHVLLTRRAAGLRRHAGEVSFPGGHVDAADGDPCRTALREAHEEIGLDPSTVRCIGALGSYATVASPTLIYPFVAVCDSVPEVCVASPGEVEAVIAVSLAELLTDEAWREEIWPFPRGERAMTFFDVPGDTIWGATAAMLRDLLTIAVAPALAAVFADSAAVGPAAPAGAASAAAAETADGALR